MVTKRPRNKELNSESDPEDEAAPSSSSSEDDVSSGTDESSSSSSESDHSPPPPPVKPKKKNTKSKEQKTAAAPKSTNVKKKARKIAVVEDLKKNARKLPPPPKLAGGALPKAPVPAKPKTSADAVELNLIGKIYRLSRTELFEILPKDSLIPRMLTSKYKEHRLDANGRFLMDGIKPMFFDMVLEWYLRPPHQRYLMALTIPFLKEDAVADSVIDGIVAATVVDDDGKETNENLTQVPYLRMLIDFAQTCDYLGVDELTDLCGELLSVFRKENLIPLKDTVINLKEVENLTLPKSELYYSVKSVYWQTHAPIPELLDNTYKAWIKEYVSKHYGQPAVDSLIVDFSDYHASICKNPEAAQRAIDYIYHQHIHKVRVTDERISL
jgi:hypothetical protein